MKITVTLLTVIILFMGLNLHAQTPQSFKYQTVVRNNSGEVISGEDVDFRFSIVKGSTNGETVYQETFLVTISEVGIATLEIGNGVPVSGDFAVIDWGDDIYFLKTELDLENTGQYDLMGFAQLLSVPYALYAENVANPDNDWQISGNNMWAVADGNVGIGTEEPMEKLHITGNLKTDDTLKFKGKVLTDESIPGQILIGDKDIKIGYQYDNYGNVLIGNSQYGKTVFDLEMTGNGNIGIGTDVFHETTTATTNVCIGMYSGYNLSTGSENVFLGASAGEHMETGNKNICIGGQSGNGRNGDLNIFIGNRAGYSWSGGGNHNVILGNYAGFNYNVINSGNIYIGQYAGYDAEDDNNVFIGPENTGRNSSGSKNIFFGYEVGKNYSGNNTLLIDNKNDNITPFIQGDMDSDQLEINADVTVNGSSTHQSLSTKSLLNLEELIDFPITPQDGDLIYLNDTLRFYNGTAWKNLW